MQPGSGLSGRCRVSNMRIEVWEPVELIPQPLLKIDEGVDRLYRQQPHLDLVKDRISDAFGYCHLPKTGEERRDSDQERTYQNCLQILRTAKDMAQTAWFHQDPECQQFGPQIFEVCNRIPPTLEEVKNDLNEIRNIAHAMETHSNENVKKLGRQLAELTTGLPGITSNGRTGYLEE